MVLCIINLPAGEEPSAVSAYKIYRHGIWLQDLCIQDAGISKQYHLSAISFKSRRIQSRILTSSKFSFYLKISVTTIYNSTLYQCLYFPILFLSKTQTHSKTARNAIKFNTTLESKETETQRRVSVSY